MTINVIYLFVTIIAIYYGTIGYFKTKNNMFLFWLAILLVSIILEIQWLNSWNYIIDTTDLFRTIRDIGRTVLMIVSFKLYLNKRKSAN
jgi:hypothetical protein